MTCWGPSVLVRYGSETEIRVLKPRNKENGTDLDRISLQLALDTNVNVHFQSDPRSGIGNCRILSPRRTLTLNECFDIPSDSYVLTLTIDRGHDRT